MAKRKNNAILGGIPLKPGWEMKDYMRAYRSRNPIESAFDQELVDIDKLKKIFRIAKHKGIIF